ncbi:succinate dehydrogenase iron-sulfur subunit [Linnemannia elongata]|nr:succinate dehydrogenase iron-sulfur subunit [Linnemannia elongata]
MVAQTPDPAFPPVQELSLTVSADIEIHRLWKTITEILSQRFHATRITLCLPQDPTADYHGDYWSIHAPLDAGYSSSASTASSYSSSSSSAIKHSRSSNLRAYGVHSNGTECFSNLQSLEYDPEPLLNEHTIDSILRAGKTVVLTREYVGSKASRRRSHKTRPPFLTDDDDDDDSSYTDTDPTTTARRMNGVEIEVGGASAMSGAFSNVANFVAAQSKAGYADFVQGLNPTWSQSPAPSPNIIKEDPTINPFFFQPLTSYPAMDDDTFDPPDPLSESTEDDSCKSHGLPSLPPLPPPPPSAMAHARSLIHVPLYRSTDHNNQRYLPSDIRHHRPPAMPVAIVSFLADQIPYPPEALDILTELNPFLANQITNALRLEDMVARSNRWGELSTSGMSESSRTNETFADSIRRKMKDTNDMTPSDLATPKADHPPSSHTKPHDADAQSPSTFTRIESDTSVASTPSNSPFNPFMLQSPDPERFSKGDPLSDVKQPESFYNLDSTTDEIHRSFKSQWKAPTREEFEKERAPLSRHGSGWSFNSDDTSLASPGLHHDRHATGRKHKKRHHGFAEKGGPAQIPRTRLLRMIVDAIAHHVFTLSPQTGCLTWLNQRSMQYTGIPLPHLLHKPWTGILHKDDEMKFQPLFKDSFEKGEMFNAQYRVRRFDGQYRWFLGRVVPVRDCGGHIVQWFGTSTDIHDQKIAELQLNRQVELELNEKKYRLLAEAIPQIVFTAAPQVGLTYANAKWFTFSGQVFEQASGLGFMDHVHPDDRAKCFLPTNISEDNIEVSYQTEMRLLRKDGKYRWFLVKCISVEVVEQGRKWFGTCTDINDQKLLEHKLKEAHDAAQKSTESKTRFLSNMSHEIRTPLVGITGMINFLITTDLTSEQLDYVHTVQQSADALLLVINDILDLSKVEAGMMKLEMEPFSVHAMTEGANELLSTLAIQKGLELGFLVEDEVPEVVIGDRNAIKFTSHGEVFSRCSLVPAKPNADPDVLTIKFEISDTGKGFDESERAVMFKPFSQVDTSSTRKHGGTGLGLVLSKEFVELHGGKIACESVKGEGSKFSFTFVARVPPPNVTARATTPIASEDIRKTATKALESATKKIKRGDFLTADLTLAIDEEDQPEQRSAATTASTTATTVTATTESPPGDVATAMTRTESILDDRRYLKVGQLTPSNPPMGEPPAVAVIAASLPNPALDMKLAIPAKVLESKALQSSMSTANSSVGSLTSTTGITSSTAANHAPEQARILVVADLLHARETILHLIKQLVPKKLDPLIDVATDLKEGVEFLVGGRKVATKAGKYNYLVINLASYMSVMDIFSAMQQDGVLVEPTVVTCVITTPIQRAAVMEAVKVEEASMEIAKSSLEASMPKVIPSNIEWVFKPLTKAKLHVALADIVTHQETLTSPNGTIGGGLGGLAGNGKMSVKRRTAQQVVVSQKEIFSQMHDAMEGKNIRILLAEDDLTNQKVIRRYFQMVGAELVIANDGNECLDKFKSQPKGHFSLILCDLFMPGKDGYEATRAIRQWEDEHLEDGEQRIPIVALSANVMANVAEQCLSSGFTSYLSKPVDFKRLSETLRKLVL